MIKMEEKLDHFLLYHLLYGIIIIGGIHNLIILIYWQSSLYLMEDLP